MFKAILGKASIIEATTDRTVASNRHQAHLLDLSSPIMQYFIKQATSYDFGGLSTVVNRPEYSKFHEINTSIMKWQDLQGNIVKKQLCICYRSTTKNTVNPTNALDAFLNKSLPVSDDIDLPNKEHCKNAVQDIDNALSSFMASNSNRYLQPADISWVNIATLIN